jgi:hypothetical protein
MVADCRNPSLKHQLHPEVYKSIFERFRNPNLAEPFLSIALLTQAPLAIRYRWQK